jgi:hypothetical protein
MVHKHEIILNFFLPKSNPYMLLVKFRKKFRFLPLIFARISKFEHFAVTERAYEEPNLLEEISKKNFSSKSSLRSY